MPAEHPARPPINMWKPQVSVRCPFHEFELAHQRRPQQAAFLHLLRGQPLLPSRSMGLGRIHERTCAISRPRNERQRLSRVAGVTRSVSGQRRRAKCPRNTRKSTHRSSWLQACNRRSRTLGCGWFAPFAMRRGADHILPAVQAFGHETFQSLGALIVARPKRHLARRS